IGLLPQALLFGAAHQIAGPSRWVWMAWATVVGLCLGAMFQLTGSLVGPLLAHALVNALNLAYLKSHDPAPQHGLGGLFRRERYPCRGFRSGRLDVSFARHVAARGDSASRHPADPGGGR